MRTLVVTLLAAAIAAFGAQVPRPSAPFTITLPNKKSEAIETQKGNVVVLAIISTTCPHCQNTVKILSKLNTEYGPKGLRIYAAAVNPEADAGIFTRQYGLNFPMGTTTREAAYGYLQHSIMAPSFYVPQLVFVDKQGVIQGQFGGSDSFFMGNEEENIRKFIEKLLAAPGASSQGAKAPVRKG